MRKKLEITERELGKFAGYLRREEREDSTIESYMRTARRFAAWLDGRAVTKELAAAWKAQLLEQGYRPVSVNAMLAAVNKLFVCMGREDCKVRYLKLQRQMFRKSERELTRAEYQRLLDAAQAQGDIRLLLLLETLCATGIRVSELQYITVEAARNGVAEIALKGKIRTILLPTKLCRKLLKYAKKCGIVHGQIFLTKNGNGLSRKFIWAEMKKLCEAAKVARSKVFPHNLRGLFARTFYAACRDVVRLADVLGHSSIETTRICLLTTRFEPVGGDACAPVLYANTVADMISFSLQTCVERNITVRRCKNCGRYFAQTGRVSAEYCDRTPLDGQSSCRAMGAFQQWTLKQADDPVFKVYRREYKRRFAWIKAGRISDSEFYAWSEQAREQKKKCDEGIITAEDFQRWLKES